MKLVFCGTPHFAVPTLQAVLRAGHRVDLVMTQPDRRSGRGMHLVAPPVKETAHAAGIAVVQPEKIKSNRELQAQLEAIKPDAIVVVAYGRIIPKWMLDLPLLGNLNLHASLLPKYRGAAPIQWAIAMGEQVTGATTMRIDEGLDTGDMLMQRELSIEPHWTSEDIFPRLAEQGAALMIETLRGLESGILQPVKQDESRATLAPILKREDGLMDFSRTATELHNRWRGFQPWPGAYTFLRGKKLVVHRMKLLEVGAVAGYGELRIEESRMLVACGAGSWLDLSEVQLEGKKRLAAAEFLRGASLKSGDRLGGQIDPVRESDPEHHPPAKGPMGK